MRTCARVFSEAFRRAVEANFFRHQQGTIKRKRGRRSPHGDDSNLPGPNSNYKQSQAMEDIKRVISIPSVRKLIYLLLFESGLLSAATLHNHIIFLFALITRLGGPDTIRKVLDLNFYPKLEALGDIDELYDTIKNLDDESLIKKAREVSAQHLSKFDSGQPDDLYVLVNRGLDYNH